MKLIQFLILIHLILVQIEIDECQMLINKANLKVNLIKNKSLNETEWNTRLLNSFKCLDQISCSAYCIKSFPCSLIRFDSNALLCNHYKGFFDKNNTKLVNAQSVNILYNLRPAYELKGILVNNKLTNHTDIIRAIAYLDNGQIATGSEDSTIIIWNQNLTLVKSWTAHNMSVEGLLVLNNGDLVSCSRDSLIKIWNSKDSWSLKQTLFGHTNWVVSLGLLSNGNLVSGSLDHNFKIWNSDGVSFTNIKTKYASHLINSLIVLKNSDIATGGHIGGIKIWESTNNYNLKSSYSASTRIMTLAELNNGDLAFAILNDYRIFVWEIGTSQIKYTLTGHTGIILKIIQLQNGDLASGSLNNRIEIWTYSKNEWKLKYNLTDSISAIRSLLQLPNGYLVAGQDNKRIMIWS